MQTKKKKNSVSKWRPNKGFLARVISILEKIWKKKKKKKIDTFLKEFFNEIWVIIGEYEYAHITEIKFGIFLLCVILWAKHFSPHPQNANWC